MLQPVTPRSSGPRSLPGLFGLVTLAVLAGFAVVFLLDTGEPAPPASVAVPDRAVTNAPPARIEAVETCAEPDEPLPSPGSDLDAWLAALPQPEDVGQSGRAVSDATYALRSDQPVLGMTVTGGSSAALRTMGPVTVACSLLEGAGDGLKPADGTSVRDSVIRVDYDLGAHSDHVQATDRDGLEIRRVRMIAENASGTLDTGWNAAVFIHDGSDDWVIEDVHVQHGAEGVAVRSHYPIRLTSGSGIVRRVVVDREAMKGPTAIQVIGDADPVVWEDVFIREPDGTLTPVPRP